MALRAAPSNILSCPLALLSAVHVTEQLPAQLDAAGRAAFPPVQGGVLEEGSISLEPPLLPSLPLYRTPTRPASL